MRPLLAHCHHGLGRLYAQIGQQQQACAALSAAVDLCRGLEMPCWLPQAEAALAQVNKTWHAQEGPPGAGKVPWESSHRKRLTVYGGRFKVTFQRAPLTWWASARYQQLLTEGEAEGFTNHVAGLPPERAYFSRWKGQTTQNLQSCPKWPLVIGDACMPAKILVVDDEPDLELLIRQRFRRHIRQQEWHFAFAHNGLEALDILRGDQEFDLVLTDINMPAMDGLTLLGKLPAPNSVLKAVVVTAYGDMGNIRTAMNRGAYDFITKPIDFADLEVTITRTLEHVQQYLRQVARLTSAAAAVEAGGFDPTSLDDVAQSGGELGRLARVFQSMVREVQARVQRLQQQVQELRIEIDQSRKASQVAEVTETDYFRRLQQEAQTLRARTTTRHGAKPTP
jgi:CheY-like chemotaxis protein